MHDGYIIAYNVLKNGLVCLFGSERNRITTSTSIPTPDTDVKVASVIVVNMVHMAINMLCFADNLGFSNGKLGP